MHFLINISAVK